MNYDFDYALTKKKYLLRRYNTIQQYEDELEGLHGQFQELQKKYRSLCYSLDEEVDSAQFKNSYQRLVKEADDRVQDIERRLVGSIKYSRSNPPSVRSRSPRSNVDQSIYSAPQREERKSELSISSSDSSCFAYLNLREEQFQFLERQSDYLFKEEVGSQFTIEQRPQPRIIFRNKKLSFVLEVANMLNTIDTINIPLLPWQSRLLKNSKILSQIKDFMLIKKEASSIEITGLRQQIRNIREHLFATISQPKLVQRMEYEIARSEIPAFQKLEELHNCYLEFKVNFYAVYCSSQRQAHLFNQKLLEIVEPHRVEQRKVESLTPDKVCFFKGKWATYQMELFSTFQVKLMVTQEEAFLSGRAAVLQQAEEQLVLSLDTELSKTIPQPVPHEILALVRLSDENEELFMKMGLIFVKENMGGQALVIAQDQALQNARILAKEQYDVIKQENVQFFNYPINARDLPLIQKQLKESFQSEIEPIIGKDGRRAFKVTGLLTNQAIGFLNAHYNMENVEIEFKPPKYWQPMSEQITRVLLSPQSQQFRNVSEEFLASIYQLPRNPFRVLQVYRIQNMHLYRFFRAHKRILKERLGEQKSRSHVLYHGTRKTSPEKIWNSDLGFDPRFSRQGNYQGYGVYFSKTAKFAHRWRNQSDIDQNRFCLFRARVVLGQEYVQENKRNFNRVVPPKKENDPTQHYDSVVNADRSRCCIYQKEMAYPEYLIYYEDSRKGGGGQNISGGTRQ